MSIEKHFLVPTDFSENAFTALAFAIQLAKESNTHIRVLHILNSKESTDSFDEAESKLHGLIRDIKAVQPQLSISACLLEGPFLSTLLEHEKDHNYQAIIMGTNGISGLKKRWLGSNTLNTIDKSSNPVWAVPLEYEPHIPVNIGFLTNFIPDEVDIFKRFTHAFGNNFQLNLLHVREINETPYPHVDSWKEKFTSVLGNDQVEYYGDTTTKRVDIADKPSDCIKDFIIDLKLDALILKYVPKSFFNNILGKNVGRNLSQDQSIPICFFK